MDFILTMHELSKRYRHFQALDKLTMHIPKGSIYGLIGRNGAGKTTLIRTIAGLQRPDEGFYCLNGIKHTDPRMAAVRQKTGAIVEMPAIYLDMSASENLQAQNLLLGKPKNDQVERRLKRLGLDQTGTKKARNFSLGMRQRLGIASALASDPEFLILDEPFNGLDPQGTADLRQLIVSLNQQGMTILISSHLLDELSRLATHYGFIDHGTLIQELSAEELQKQCRGGWRLTVTNPQLCIQVAQRLHYACEQAENDVLIDGGGNISELLLKLAEAGCPVQALHQQDESLESYYLDLIGGDKHA